MLFGNTGIVSPVNSDACLVKEPCEMKIMHFDKESFNQTVMTIVLYSQQLARWIIDGPMRQ